MGFLASRVLAAIVYQATPRDPLVLAGVVLVMGLLGAVVGGLFGGFDERAAYRPANRFRWVGGIVLAAIGFQFLVWVAGYIGAIFGSLAVVLAPLLTAVAAFFLIYAIPAAAIGGMPGSLAISASVREGVASPLGCECQ